MKVRDWQCIYAQKFINKNDANNNTTPEILEIRQKETMFIGYTRMALRAD